MPRMGFMYSADADACNVARVSCNITPGSAGQLALTVIEGIMEGLRHQDRPRRQWIHDIEEWTGCEYNQLKEMSQDRALHNG